MSGHVFDYDSGKVYNWKGDTSGRGYIVVTDTSGNIIDIVQAADDDTNLDGKNGTATNSIANFRIDADTIKPARMDASTHSIQTIEYEHHEIHAGGSFSCVYTQDVTDTNDRSIITFLTPSTTKYLHITVAASATGVSMATIFEAPTVTNNEGDTLVVYNRNRVGTPTATTVWDTSTDPNTQGQATYFSIANMAQVTGGTSIASTPLGAATSPVKSIGGMARATQEWILKPATLYAFEIKSLDASDNTHWIELDYYEHTDKD